MLSPGVTQRPSLLLPGSQLLCRNSCCAVFVADVVANTETMFSVTRQNEKKIQGRVYFRSDFSYSWDLEEFL